MGRAPDERPPIEILGSDLGVSSTQQVAMGPRRKPGRGRSLAVVALVVALLVGGVVLGGTDDPAETAAEEERDDEDRNGLDEPQTSTTARRTTTTTEPTTTTAPLGPLFGEPVEGALLLFSGTGWRVLDLTTGAMHDVNLPTTTDPYASVSFAGGIVLMDAGQAAFYPILGAGGDPAARELGPADTVLRAGPDRVWLVDLPPDDGELAPRVDARLVDVDGTVHRSLQVPGRWLDRATEEVVLLSRGGRVYAADEDGLRAIAVGWTTATNGGAAVVLTCDVQASCSLRRQPVDGSPGRVLFEVPDADAVYYDAFEAPDGRLGLVSNNQFGATAAILFFAPDGSSLGQVELSASSLSSVPQWLPNDLGVVVSSGRGLEWVRPVAGGWEVTPLEGPGRTQESLFVITP